MKYLQIDNWIYRKDKIIAVYLREPQQDGKWFVVIKLSKQDLRDNEPTDIPVFISTNHVECKALFDKLFITLNAV